MTFQPILAVMLGGWEIVLILAIVILITLAFVTAVIFIAVWCWRNQRKVPPVVPSSNSPPRR